MPIRSFLLSTTALASLGAVWVAAAHGADATLIYAGTQPAVSAPNVKFDLFGGWSDADTGITDYGGELFGAAGSFTTPVGHSFGLQIDGLIASWGGDPLYGVGGHFFWRDPERAMLGIYAGYDALDRGGWPAIGVGPGVHAAQVAAEGELYWGNATLYAMGGWEGGDIPSGFFTYLDLDYYATPDLQLSVGYRYTGGLSALAVGAEWLVPGQIIGGRPSLFAEGRVGQSNYKAVWGGLRLYFGPSQTLIEKHRRDDPNNVLPEGMFPIQEEIANLDVLNKDASSGPPASS